jgi:uncharacterized protein GlcG (DUF336 family)
MRLDRFIALVVLGAAACTTVQTATAQGLLTTHRISAALANEAVGAAVAACAEKGYAVTAVLVDSDGVRQAMLRGDNAGIHTTEAAADKAYTSASIKVDLSVLAERFKTTPAPSVLAKTPHLVLSPGAIVLKIGDEAIGALGVSGAPGGEKDEACAHAGLDKIKDRLK